MLACLGGLVALLNIRSIPNSPLYIAGTLVLLILGIMSLVGVVNRYSWAVPLIWIWIGIWALLSIIGGVAALASGSYEAFTAVMQLLVYAIILIVFVGKALREGERYFGPNRIDEYALHLELAYREINSIP